MIILRKKEKLRRRYPATLKKYGKGYFSITDERICFETDKHGCVLEMEMDRLYNWTKKKKSIIIRWMESKQPKQKDTYKIFAPVGRIGSCEIEKFGKWNGSKVDMQEVHLALFYAFCDYFTYGTKGIGFYGTVEGKGYNHFFNDRKQMELDQWSEKHNMRGMIKQVNEEIAKYLKKATGETLLDQEAMKYLKLREAWKYDERIHRTSKVLSSAMERSENEEFKGCGPSKIGINDNITYGGGLPHTIEQWEADIRKWEAEGNTDKLEEYREPSNVVKKGWNRKFKGGTVYDIVKGLKEDIVLKTRLNEILLEQTFTTTRQHEQYADEVDKILTEKYERGEDISNYTPQVELAEDKTASAIQFLREYKKKIKQIP